MVGQLRESDGARPSETCKRSVGGNCELQFWSKRKEELAAVNQSYRATLKPSEQQVVGKLDFFLLQEMVDASQHVDRDYVAALAQGFAVTGNLDDGSLGVPIAGGQRVHGKPGLGGAPPIRLETALQSHQ